MKAFLAFTKKELIEQVRTSKLMVLALVFSLFGVMNPAVAKLTPWLLETLSESMSESGMTITVASVTALDSWAQFFKNVPMALIVFVLLESGIFTREYRSGTLMLSLTKGLHRYKVILSKTVVLVLLWSLGFWLCFGITYGYNAYFWDNSVAHSLLFGTVAWWLFGMLVISLTVLFSVLSQGSTGVLLGTGGVVFLSYLLGIIPRIQKYLPTRLADGTSLIYGMEEPRSYLAAMVITAALTLVCLVASIPIFNKKQL